MGSDTKGSQMKYYIQLRQNTKVFDLVPEFIFDKRTKVVNEDGYERYSPNYFTFDHEKITVEMTEARRDTFATMAFLVNSKNYQPPIIPGGFVNKPEFLHIRSSNSIILYHVPSGTRYRRVPNAKT